MSRLDERNNAERIIFGEEALVSRDDPSQSPADYRVLYVLGFGIAGAILANMTLFIYFVAVYASG